MNYKNLAVKEKINALDSLGGVSFENITHYLLLLAIK